MSLNTTHNGHEITYDEGDDTWCCRALELKTKSLSTMKQKINDVDNAERRIGGKTGVKALYLGYNMMRDCDEVVATMIDHNGSAVWVKNKAGTRSKVGVHSLLADTAENRAVIEEARQIVKEADVKRKSGEDMIRNLKRMTVDDLKAASLEVKPK